MKSKQLIISFSGIVLFLVIIFGGHCVPYLNNLRGWTGTSLGVFVSLGLVASILIFIRSFLTSTPLSNGKKALCLLIILPLFMMFFRGMLHNFFANFCS